MSFNKSITLNNGVQMPRLGLGTWQSPAGQVEKAVEHALRSGYRHIDAALIYGNQDEVGQGIKNSGVKREEIFLVSKLWNNSHRPENVAADLETTLKQLGTDYLDLWLIHWPVPFAPGENLSPLTSDKSQTVIDREAPGIVETWKAVVDIYKNSNKVKAIGVSNFSKKHLDMIIDATGVVPAVNQIEAHPGLQQDELEAYGKEKGIHFTAYSPLGNNITGKPRIVDSDEVKAIAKSAGVDPAQVLVAWITQKGFSVIPKSVTPSRIESNFQEIELSKEDVETITALGRKNAVRYNVPYLYSPQWDIDVFDTPEEKDASVKVW
ncbi:NADP-dependent oxidoreductase domain-containing protein [Filobasidium floriforme]|uniref:NADP-dependent oxidoreductase domain-containing protein n=1 Tax=Filobasidium floriforme TaxID=5210 RepID=UPI001E8CCC5F|nr:NADP-dependent oxidoreductase domain-containing protein [Filobasidium floriforme]KAH8083485.1 NADP-dependent oxidoreductase domain-containing protein [Filobasidium floriforme]